MHHQASSQPAPRRPRRPRLLVAATAIVAVITILGSGVAVAERGGSGRTHQAKRVAGVVAAVNAPTFSVQRRNAKTITVVTNAQTKYSKTTDATVADAVPGSFVVLRGRRNADRSGVAARHIHIRPAPTADKDRKAARGATVLTNDGATLTVKRANDRVITVTTTADTRVRKTIRATFGDLAVGQYVHVGGTRNADATFIARRVAIDSSTRPVERRPKPKDEARQQRRRA